MSGLIINPGYVPAAVAAKAEAAHVKHAAAVIAVVMGDTARERVSFSEVRAAVGLDDKALPDGAIHQICIDAGLRVEV